ncbi:MAG: hypothetical protein AAGG50_15130 [Bacteroidota bacterium]
MGQQQLLLLVLSIVLVGLAVANGIQAFEENNRKNRRDVATTAAIDYVSNMLSWREKPVALGGGGGTWDNFSLEQIGYEADGTCRLNNRPYITLPDNSQLALAVSVQSGKTLAVWFPNGDCEQRWLWDFHVYMRGSTLQDIDFVGCNSNHPDYPWADGSQCADW